MERAFACCASIACCRNAENDANDREASNKCSTCGLSQSKMKKLESALQKRTNELKKTLKQLANTHKITKQQILKFAEFHQESLANIKQKLCKHQLVVKERDNLKIENEELHTEIDEFQQVIHELELSNVQIQSKYDLSEERRKYHLKVSHLQSQIDSRPNIDRVNKQHFEDDIKSPSAPIAAPIPVQSAPMAMAAPLPPQMSTILQNRLSLERQQSQQQIAELETTIKNLERQSSILNMQVGEFRRRDSRRSLLAFHPIAIGPHFAASSMPRKPQIKPSIAMKTLHWKHIPDNKIKHTVWEQISKIEDDIVSKDIGQKQAADAAFLDALFEDLETNEFVSKRLIKEMQHFLIANEYDSDALEQDVADYAVGSNVYAANEEFVHLIKQHTKKQHTQMSLRSLEQLFPRKEKAKKGRKRRGRQRLRVQMFEIKRARNVAIGLGGLKMRIGDIKWAILRMNEEIMTVEFLGKLIPLAPSPEEIRIVQSYNGKVKELGECEQFFLQFRNMENVKARLEVWLFKRDFEEKYTHRMQQVLALTFMQETIRNSQHFKQVLAALLAAGNFINGGTAKGGKHGFVLKTLQKVGAYRSTDNKMSILGYLYKYLRDNYPAALEWIDEFDDLPEVVRIESDQLDQDITAISNELRKLGAMLRGTQESKERDDRFEKAMDEFYNETVAKLEDLQQGWFDCMVDIQDLAAFFGEEVKAAKFTTEEFFGIFNVFRNEFMEHRDKIIKAEQQKERREIRQERKLKRLTELKEMMRSTEDIDGKRRRRFRRKKRRRKGVKAKGGERKQKYLQVDDTGISGIDSELGYGYYTSDIQTGYDNDD